MSDIDQLISEGLIPLSRAASIVPSRRGGRPTHPTTLHRWARHGIRGVKLEAAQIGGVVCTSTGALARFFAELTRRRGRSAADDQTRIRQIQEADRQAAALLK